MKKIWIVCLLSLLLGGSVFAQKFSRDLPGEDFRKSLVQERFPNQDAVIILKEQNLSFSETTAFDASYTQEIGFYDYEGEFQSTTGGGRMVKGLCTARRNVMIVKLFNEAAIKRYGSFEYSYMDMEQEKNLFAAMVRVLKTDGKIWVMPKDMIKIETMAEKGQKVLARKVVFKVPNLPPGDILQIEYITQNWYEVMSKIIHYYNERDLTLFANFSVTVPAKTKVSFKSFPADTVPQPTVTLASQSKNSGDTYFWSLRNVPGIPAEAFSFPFADQALMSTLMVESWGRYGKSTVDWKGEMENYYSAIDGKGVPDEDVEALNVKLDKFSASAPAEQMWAMVGGLYSAIRRGIVLNEESGLIPESEKIHNVFKNGKGRSSDLAYIMYRILRSRDFNVRLALVRDMRQGRYPKEIPTVSWFDRLGVWVNIGGTEKLYDFTPASANVYAQPWFLSQVEVLVFDKNGYEFKAINQPLKMEENVIQESHELAIGADGQMKDTLTIRRSGMEANYFRQDNFKDSKDEMTKSYKELLAKSCLQTVDTLTFNNYNEEADVVMTAVGTVKNPAEAFENLITCKLPVYQLARYREKLFTSLRYTNINFNAPFQIQMRYNLPLPAGYSLKTQLQNRTFQGVGGMTAKLDYTVDGGKLQAVLSLNFPLPAMMKHLYPELIKYFDNILLELGRDIVLEKK